MKTLVTIILMVLLGFIGAAQTYLTKDEILISWVSSKNKPDTLKDLRSISFDHKANKRIIEIIDSLNNKGIDSLIIYSIAYPGYVSTDPCISPDYSYLLWKSNEDINIKSIRGKCESNITKIDSLNIFNYYRTNQEFIKKETIMPVILNAQRSSKNKITYSTSSIDHEPNYSLYLIFIDSFKNITFTQNDIQNEKSLFHEYNLNLKSIQLWKLIKNEIGDSSD